MGNYYNSVTQFLQAEKTIRLRSLVSIGYNMKEKTIRLRSLVSVGYMKEIHGTFSDTILRKTAENEEEFN